MRIGYAHDRFFAYGNGRRAARGAKVPFPHVPGLRSLTRPMCSALALMWRSQTALRSARNIHAPTITDLTAKICSSRLMCSMQRFNARLTYKIN